MPTTEKSLNPYFEIDLKDSEGPSEPGVTIGLPHFIEWALERSMTPFSRMRQIPFHPIHSGKRIRID